VVAASAALLSFGEQEWRTKKVGKETPVPIFDNQVQKIR